MSISLKSREQLNLFYDRMLQRLDRIFEHMYDRINRLRSVWDSSHAQYHREREDIIRTTLENTLDLIHDTVNALPDEESHKGNYTPEAIVLIYHAFREYVRKVHRGELRQHTLSHTGDTTLTHIMGQLTDEWTAAHQNLQFFLHRRAPSA